MTVPQLTLNGWERTGLLRDGPPGMLSEMSAST